MASSFVFRQNLARGKYRFCLKGHAQFRKPTKMHDLCSFSTAWVQPHSHAHSFLKQELLLV